MNVSVVQLNRTSNLIEYYNTFLGLGPKWLVIQALRSEMILYKPSMDFICKEITKQFSSTADFIVYMKEGVTPYESLLFFVTWEDDKDSTLVQLMTDINDSVRTLGRALKQL